MLDAFQVLLDEALFFFLGGSFGLGSGGFVSGLLQGFFGDGGVEHEGDAAGVDLAFAQHLGELGGMDDLGVHAQAHAFQILFSQRHPAGGQDHGADVEGLFAVGGGHGGLELAGLAFQFGHAGVQQHGDAAVAGHSGDFFGQVGGLAVFPGSLQGRAHGHVVDRAAELVGLFHQDDFIAGLGGFLGGGEAGPAATDDQDALDAFDGRRFGHVALLQFDHAHVHVVGGHLGSAGREPRR